MPSSLFNMMICITTFMILICVSPAFSEDDIAMTQDFRICISNVDLGFFKNTQFADCYWDEFERQDKRLNVEYQKLQICIPAETKSLLVKGQGAWINFRDSWCKYEAALPYAPISEVNFYACKVKLTIAQSSKLRNSWRCR